MSFVNDLENGGIWGKGLFSVFVLLTFQICMQLLLWSDRTKATTETHHIFVALNLLEIDMFCKCQPVNEFIFGSIDSNEFIFS